MDNILWQQIGCVKPQNWRELAEAAQFVRVQFGSFIADEVLKISELLKESSGRNRTSLQLRECLTILELFGAITQEAKYVQFGARAACIETLRGNFKNQQGIHRAAEALEAGKLIDEFAVAAQSLITLKLGQKLARNNNQDRFIEVIDGLQEIEDFGTEKIFDGALRIRFTHEEHHTPLRPKAETIVTVVKEELGYLPSNIAQSIRDTMAFKLG